MKFAGIDDTLEEVGLRSGIGLMHKALVACPCSARFIGINAGDYHQSVGHFILYRYQSGNVVDNAVFIICRARPYNKYEPAALP